MKYGDRINEGKPNWSEEGNEKLHKLERNISENLSFAVDIPHLYYYSNT